MSGKINAVGATESVAATQSVKNVETKGAKNVPMVDENQKPQEQVAAKNKLGEDIKSGNAVYNQSNILGDLGALIFDKKAGDNVIIDGLPKGTTLGEVRKMYNLPVGSLRHLVTKGGGNFDSYSAPTSGDSSYVYIYADDLAEGLGISERELKGMFPDTQFSPWYKLGTKK